MMMNNRRVSVAMMLLGYIFLSGALRAEVRDIELDVNTLIADMNKSIREADDFLKTLQ
jgi:hypothetical protein